MRPPPPTTRLTAFLESFRAVLVVLSGEAEGMEYVLDQPRVLVGRGPGVDLALDDPSLERVHVALEFDGEGYRLAPVGGDGEPTRAFGPTAELKAEDRFVLGSIAFEYLLETRQGSIS